MSADLSLFGNSEDDALAKSQPAASDVVPIAQWQIDLLRKALDARGLVSMENRQQAIEAAAGRPIVSLRALTHDEALSVLARLGPAPERQRSGSSWDQRDEDTWIDRI